MNINLLDKEQSGFGFTAGHFMLIAACIVVLLGFGFLKGDISWASLTTNVPFLKASSAQPAAVTYESVRAQVEAEVLAQTGATDTSSADAKQQQDLALIDPSFGQGAVLGASTGDLPSVDELLTDANMQKIQVKTVAGTTKDTAQKYADQLHFLENYYDTASLLNALSTADQSLLPGAPARYSGLVAALSDMPVPDQLAEFHKGKILYYSTLLTLAQSMSSNDYDEQASTAGVIFFGITDKLDSISNDILNRYGVEL